MMLQPNRAKAVFLKLTPAFRMLMISESFAIREVKKITEIKENKGQSMALIWGIKFK